MLVIFLFSHQPYSGRITEEYLGGLNVPVRKLGHLTEYFVLFLLVHWAMIAPQNPGAEKHGRAKFFIIPAVISVLYAISDEFHQNFVPGRSASISDVLVDATGVLIAVIALKLYRRWKLLN
ncbi:MAG: VanZ family protein [Cyanobacteria bacterium HKST-UBA02]|nr:VanZ family protein [Cyanobacteria bacterium HKST-UBA02]